MIGDLKFCSMFMPLCSSVCFRNVKPIGYRRAQKKKRDKIDRSFSSRFLKVGRMLSL